MDADDVARPERLARQLAYMRAHPDCAAVGGEVLLIDPDGWPLRIQGVALGHAEIETALLRGRGEAIVHPVALFRHAALKTVGGYRTECEPAEDLDLYLRLAHHGRLANLPETLLEYRQHPRKVSHARGAEQREMVNAVLREARRRRGLGEGDVAPLPPVVVANAADCHREWTRLALEGHHLATARKHARAALRAEPGNRRSWQLWVLAWLGLPVETVKRALRGAGSER